MTIVNDEAVFNVAGTQANWTAQDFDPPVDNNSSSAVQINREGTACQEWVLKENITTGYTFTSTLGGTKDISNGEVVVFWFFVTSDADFDKLSLFRLRLSSDTGFTTNYAEWDGKAQIEGLDLYGWFPVTVYPANPDATAGTIVYSSIDSIGWVATTGGTGTKLTGFDQCHSISYIGGHSQTVTLANLQSENDTNDLGVMFSFGDFSKIRVNVRLGGGTTANTVFEEVNKSLFFDNVEPEHNLGFQFINPSSTGEVHFNLPGWAVSWNDQTGTSPEIFTNPEHCDEFTITGGSFTRGGAFTTRTRINDTVTFVDGPAIINCDRIDPRDLLFQNVTVDDSRITAADNGALLLDSEGSARWHNLSFTRGGSSHAIVITSTGTYTFDNFTYSGYGAADTNTSTIRNESGGAVTINVSGGNTPTADDRLAGSVTTINNSVTVTLSGVTEGTPVKVEAAETVGTRTTGDTLSQGFADNLGVYSFAIDYEAAFDPSGLDARVIARNQGVAVAAIAENTPAFTDETTEASSGTTNDMTLLPAVPIVNDAYYLGHNEQFNRLKVDVSTVLTFSVQPTIVWEYWNGTIWTALSGVTDGTSGFETSGENIVSYTLPGDWATTTVNSQGPLFYVRARLSVAGTITQVPVGAKATLDTTRYLPYDVIRTISSTGLSDVANWAVDAISKFDPTD